MRRGSVRRETHEAAAGILNRMQATPPREHQQGVRAKSFRGRWWRRLSAGRLAACLAYATAASCGDSADSGSVGGAGSEGDGTGSSEDGATETLPTNTGDSTSEADASSSSATGGPEAPVSVLAKRLRNGNLDIYVSNHDAASCMVPFALPPEYSVPDFCPRDALWTVKLSIAAPVTAPGSYVYPRTIQGSATQIGGTPCSLSGGSGIQSASVQLASLTTDSIAGALENVMAFGTMEPLEFEFDIVPCS